MRPLEKYLAFGLVGIFFLSLLVLVPTASAAAYHEPIKIFGDDNFTEANGVIGGTGTENNPYIIAGWVIDASDNNAIYIIETTAYFVITNCRLRASQPYTSIELASVQNGIVQNNTFSGFYGIYLSNGSTNNYIYRNTLQNLVGTGIILTTSSYNTVAYNISKNNMIGILLQASSHNTIQNNVFSANSSSYAGGIWVDDSSNFNTITHNTIQNNMGAGIKLNSSTFNIFTYNYLIFNTTNVSADDSSNFWDNAGKGNYWSDWQPPLHPDEDEDDVVDMPKPISTNNTDYYPLVIVEPEFIEVPDINPGVYGLVQFLLPFTGGNVEVAGYLVAIIFIIGPLTIIPVAISASGRSGKHGGLMILVFYMLGVSISTITGLFPWWFMVFNIAIIALAFAKDWI